MDQSGMEGYLGINNPAMIQTNIYEIKYGAFPGKLKIINPT